MKTNSSLVNVRDPEFIKMLLPKAGQYEGLKTLVSKWEGMPSGAFLSDLYNGVLSRYMKVYAFGVVLLIFDILGFLLFLGLMILLELPGLNATGFVQEIREPNLLIWLVVGLYSIPLLITLLSVWIFSKCSTYVSIKSKSIDELQEVLEVIHNYTEISSELFWKTASFSKFTNIFQEHLKDLVEHVFDLEIEFNADNTNSKLLEKLCIARLEMNRFSKVYKSLIGSEKAELGQYFDRVKKSEVTPHVCD